MQIDKQDFLNRCNAGLVMAGVDSDGDMDWVGKDKNWTAYTWLTDGVSEENVHSYLMTQA